MVTVERTWNAELVRQAMTHPRIYPMLADDGCPPAAEFQPVMHDSITYLAVHVDDAFAGVFMLVPANSFTGEVHTALLPNAWGEPGMEAQHAALAWAWQNTRLVRIITQVPRYNTLARRFAERVGFTPFGINPRSFMRNGQLHDIVLLGISKE